MKLSLRDRLTQFARVLQGVLFPALQEELGPLTEKQQQVVAVLDMVHLEAFIAPACGGVGRPAADRRAIARAFVAKAVYNLSHTRQLLERLACDTTLRRLSFYAPRVAAQRAVTIYNCVDPGPPSSTVSPIPAWNGQPFRFPALSTTPRIVLFFRSRL